MRKLITSDLFCAMRVIKKAGLRDELKPLLLRIEQNKTDVTDVGVETVLTILETFAEHDAEQEIYKFLAGPFEMAPAEVSELSLEELAKCIKTLVSENDLTSFFASALGMNG